MTSPGRRCATCARPLPATGAVGPFCSERCRLIDLGAWLTDGARAIPAGRGDDAADDAIGSPPEDGQDPPSR